MLLLSQDIALNFLLDTTAELLPSSGPDNCILYDWQVESHHGLPGDICGHHSCCNIEVPVKNLNTLHARRMNVQGSGHTANNFAFWHIVLLLPFTFYKSSCTSAPTDNIYEMLPILNVIYNYVCAFLSMPSSHDVNCDHCRELFNLDTIHLESTQGITFLFDHLVAYFSLRKLNVGINQRTARVSQSLTLVFICDRL